MQKKGKMRRVLSMTVAGILATGCLATAAEHTHSLKEDLVIQPTCLTGGFTVYVCEESGCGYSVKSDFTDPVAHTEEIVPGVAATCTTAGLTDGTKCSVCGEILTAQEEIPAAHMLEAGLVVNPTCQAGGYTVYECKVDGCGYSVKGDLTDPAAHTEETVPGVAATCTTAGLTDGTKCSVCGEILTAQEEIPATHMLEAGLVVDPTCQAGGYTVYECKVDGCGYSVKSDFTDKLAHTEETVPGTAATCTTAGLTDGVKCSACGETLKAQEEVPAAGHTEEVVAGTAATCTTAGLTDGTKCSVCGEILKAQEEVPAAGHTEEVVAGTAATCTTAGLTDGVKCSVCGEILKAQEEVPAGHKLTLTEAKDATETAEGNKAYYVCSVCGKLYEDAMATVETSATAVVIPMIPQKSEESEPVTEKETETATEKETEKETETVTEEETEAETEEETEQETEKVTVSKQPSEKTQVSKTSESDNSAAPLTGDNTPVALCFVMLLLSGAGILVLFRRMRTAR